MIIESLFKNRKKGEEYKNSKFINSFFNIFNTPRPKANIFLKNSLIMKKNKTMMKDNQTSTDSFTYKYNIYNNKNISVNKNIIDILSLKNILRPKSNIFISNLYNNNLIIKKNRKNNNNSTRMPKINENKFKFIKEKIKLDENFPLKKRIFSSYKRKKNKSLNFNNINIINNKNINININNIAINNNENNIEENINKVKKRANLVDIENSMNCYKKNIKKKINNFFNNKFLQENTDIFKVGKNINTKNGLTIKFSAPKNRNTNNIIIDNNISLENTFKEQTLSNFNNKYYFKFKTNNLEEKEKIKQLFYLLKKHKDSETDKNCDFLAFHLYKQKKLRKKEINKAILEEYSSPCVYIGRNNDSIFINKEYYTNKNDYENPLIQKQKEKKMIRIKSLNKYN